MAWCFGQGSRWIRRQATTPRFGLLAALNAMAAAELGEQVGIGVTGASLAARDGNLRRASLTAAVPTASDAIPRIDTLADVLVGARIRTGHGLLGRVAAGRSLQFSATVSSTSDFQSMSDVIVDLAGQDLYRRSHGWIDFIVPETDESVIEAVLERVWQGSDDVGRPIDVDIAWCDESRDADSDHPVTHWRLAGERTSKLAVRNLALTWPGVKSRLTGRLGSAASRYALATDIRFFSNTEDELDRCPVVDLLSAELPIDGITYVLADGEIYRVDADFLAALDRDLQRLVIPSTLVPYRPGEPEDAYNRRAAKATGMLLLDKTDIRPTGMTQIEPCDLLGRDGTLCHVKRHAAATGISHLANQGVTAATVLLRRPESRDKLAALIEQGSWDADGKREVQELLNRIAGSNARLPVTFAIIGEWRRVVSRRWCK